MGKRETTTRCPWATELVVTIRVAKAKASEPIETELHLARQCERGTDHPPGQHLITPPPIRFRED